MINICIVEDEAAQADLLRNYIQTYGNKTKKQFAITHFTDGIDLVDEYRAQFDIILLDIAACISICGRNTADWFMDSKYDRGSGNNVLFIIHSA